MLLGAALVVAGALVFLLPPLTRDDHAVNATPSPPPLQQISVIQVPGGGRACLANVVLDAGSQVAHFQVGTFGKPGPPLAVTAAGRHYAVPAGFPDNTPLAVALRPPAGNVATTFCIRDGGRRRIALYASAELRTRSRVAVTVNGHPVGADATLTLDRRQARSVLDQLSSVVVRTTRWRPGVAPWFVWLLGVLVLLGVPGGVLWALGRSVREEALEPVPERFGARVGDDVAR